MDIKTFGRFLADLRKEKKLTQQEVADALFVNVKTISKWETCRGYPDVEKFPAIANYFSISIDELINCKKDIKLVADQQRFEKLKVVNEEQKKEIELFKKAINKKENIIMTTVILLVAVIVIGTFAILYNYFIKQHDNSLLSTQLYVENLNFECDKKDPYFFETVYDGKMKIFDIHIFSIEEDKYITNEDVDGQDINQFVKISYTIDNDPKLIEINNFNVWPKNVGEYTFYIKFSPLKIYTENMITFKLKISYFVTDLTDIDNENTVILTEKLEQVVKFEASASGRYLFSTDGSAKNSIHTTKGTVTAKGTYSNQLDVFLNKNEVIDFLVLKDKYQGDVSINVAFKPESIQINDMKSFALTPKQEMYFIYYSRGIEDSFDYAVLSNNTINIRIYGTTNYNINNYKNDILSENGDNGNNSILKNNGSILASNYFKAYYIHIQNNTENETCDVELSVNEIESVSFDIQEDLNNKLLWEKQLSFNNKKVVSITTHFRAYLNFLVKSEYYSDFSLYDEKGRCIASHKDTYLIFLEKGVKYYLQILHYSSNSVLEIKNDPIKLKYGQNDFSSHYSSHLMQYEHSAITANYNITSTINLKIFDTNFLPLLADEDGTFTFEIGSKYFFVADLVDNVKFTIEIFINSTEKLTGNLDLNGMKIIKYTPLRSGNYRIVGAEQYSWYTAEYFNKINVPLYSNEDYYLKIIGTPLSIYAIEIVLVRDEIKLESNTLIVPGNKYFVVPHDGVYSFRTYVSNLVASELYINDQDDNPVSGKLCVDKEKYSIYLPKGVYNITLRANMNGSKINVWITTEVDFERTQIPIAPGLSVERNTGTYYIIIEESANYSFKTFRNSNDVASNISLFGNDGTAFLENICTDLIPIEVYLEKGIYYLNLNTSPYHSTVNIRVKKL